MFGFTGFGSGANAEYVCMAQSGSVEIMPSNVGFDDAAALVDGPSTALYFLRDKAQSVPAKGCSSTAHPGASAPMPCSSRGTSAQK